MSPNTCFEDMSFVNLFVLVTQNLIGNSNGTNYINTKYYSLYEFVLLFLFAIQFINRFEI